MRYRLNVLMVMGLLSVIPINATESKESKFKDLQKKTALGFRVPYTLRYNSDEWACQHTDGGQDFVSLKNSTLKFIIHSDPKEINLSREELDRRFQEHVRNLHSDPSLCAHYEINPSELVVINGINFLHQREIIHLSPERIRQRAQRQRGYSSTALGQDQMDFYVYSGDQGSIYVSIESEGILCANDQSLIDELFRGFSFDGSACKGPKGLRSFKTAFEFLTDK